MTARRTFPIVLILCVILAAAYCSIANHAKVAHANQLMGSLDVYNTIEAVSINPGACKVLVVANCLFSVNQDKTSNNYGQLSPQARVYCGDAESGIMGVFGLLNPEAPIYITGYVISKARFDKYCVRDQCVIMDLTYLQWLVR